ncbi:hypothetical protein N9F44_00620 [Akkermansiaceae bacterium]|nr:hypothetical protein [Akkermansiaceae bacterium]
MKTLRILIISTIVMGSALGAAPSELAKLDKQRLDKIEEINASYIEQCEKLKLKYMTKGDLDSANKVQARIDSIASNINEPSLNKFEDSRWAWGSGGVLTLQKNGVARHTSWGHRSGKWKLYKDGTMKITIGNSVFEVTFSSDMQGEVIHSKGGAKTTITRKK